VNAALPACHAPGATISGKFYYSMNFPANRRADIFTGAKAHIQVISDAQVGL